ncbi:MAG: DNA-binding protein [Oligoflexia bacterium]|nr:DNA-binding protein [Oligoflexia bacterium]
MKTHAFRLLPGQDLRKEIFAFAASRGLQAAAVLTCVGSVKHAFLRLPGRSTATRFDGPWEICSLVGTVADGAGPHLHASFSDESGKTIGGHLMEGNEIFTTAEIVLAELVGLEFSREHDPATGYRELKITERA